MSKNLKIGAKLPEISYLEGMRSVFKTDKTCITNDIFNSQKINVSNAHPSLSKSSRNNHPRMLIIYPVEGSVGDVKVISSAAANFIRFSANSASIASLTACSF